MKEKTKAIIIDLAILCVYGLVLMITLYYIYEKIPSLSRLVAMLVIFINIPIIWGSLICSITHKKTLGHIIISKIHALHQK